MANKILTDGPVGSVVAIDDYMIQVQLNNKTQAVDKNWKQLVGPGQNVLMFYYEDDIEIGDEVIIKDEDLCLKKNNSSLICDRILCSL